MSARQKCPASLTVGSVLYSAFFDTDYDTGKTTGTVYEEVVRSIQRGRNTAPDSPKFATIVTKIEGLTWVDTTKLPATRYGKKQPKTQGWASYIPESCKKRFVLGRDLPPGIYTTRLLAIKSAISYLQNEIKWYDENIATTKKETSSDAEHLAELVREKEGFEKRCAWQNLF